MSSILVTGTSRGIGLEVVRQLLAQPESIVKKVLAVTRDTKSESLATLIKDSNGRAVNIVITNISDEKTIQGALPSIEEALGGTALDILINNAGAASWDSDGLAAVTASALTDLHNINVGSVHAMTSTLLPLLRKSSRKEVVNISTPLGSLAMVDQYKWFPSVGYKTSKAALNILTKVWAEEYGKEGFNIFALSPGWLRTDMGSERADLPVELGVKSVVDIVLSADSSSHGRFRNIHVPGYEELEGPNQYHGKDIPW